MWHGVLTAETAVEKPDAYVLSSAFLAVAAWEGGAADQQSAAGSKETSRNPEGAVR